MLASFSFRDILLIRIVINVSKEDTINNELRYAKLRQTFGLKSFTSRNCSYMTRFLHTYNTDSEDKLHIQIVSYLFSLHCFVINVACTLIKSITYKCWQNT